MSQTIVEIINSQEPREYELMKKKENNQEKTMLWQNWNWNKPNSVDDKINEQTFACDSVTKIANTEFTLPLPLTSHFSLRKLM